MTIKKKTIKKRYIILFLIALWFVYLLGFSSYESQWQNHGSIEIDGDQAYSYHLLSDLDHWPDWLMWSWNPMPKIKQTRDALGAVGLVQESGGDIIAKIRLSPPNPMIQTGFSVTVGTGMDAMAGSCSVRLEPLGINSEKHRVKWNCQGQYHDDYSKVLRRLDLYPDPPFGIGESFDRLRVVVENPDPKKWPLSE